MKKWLAAIPLSRLLIYATILAFLPLSACVWHLFQTKKSWDAVLDQMAAVHQLNETKIRKQQINSLVRAKYASSDPRYLEKQGENLLFLKREIEALEHMMQSPSFTGNEGAQRRFLYLTGSSNRLQLTEGSCQTAEGIQETTWVTAHPVELDSVDLKELLSHLEGNWPGKPQLLLSDFKLIKKRHPWGSEVYELDLKLIKRDFLK